jgi:hypothetical protein
MWFYNDPSLYDKLVRQRGWPISRFQAWLAEALQVQLLGISPRTELPGTELPGQKS